MAPLLTLYRANGACSLVPHILLRELGIPFTSVLMTFTPNGVEGADGSLSHAEYLIINPAGHVPALQVGGEEVITELPAILTYIASLAPDKELLGSDGLQKAKVYQWLCWLSGTMHGWAYGMILRPARFTDDAAAHPGVIAKGRKKIEECYGRIESSLESEHVVGGRFTVVDINMYVFWRWGERFEFEMRERYPKYDRLVQTVEQMESVKAAVMEEQLSLQFA